MKIIRFIKHLCRDAAVFRTPLSFITLSVFPRAFRILTKIGIPVPKYFIAFCPDGTKFLYSTLDGGIPITLLEIFGNKEYFLLNSHLPKRGDVIVDCGAYVGLYTLLSSKLCDKNGEVISIEPEPTSSDILKNNIRLNKIKNVKLFNIALMNRMGDIELLVPKVSRGGSTFFKNHLRAQKIKRYDKIKVKAMTLDEFAKIENLDHINIMKIDVEGAELAVLKGAQNSLRNKKVNKLIIEIHKTINPPQKIIDFLIKNEYNIDAYFDFNELKGMLYASTRDRK